MSRPTLRLFDGFDHTTPQLREDVKELQELLQARGFNIAASGLFDRDTEDAVIIFQRENGLDDDGVVGPLTWAALLGEEPPEDPDVFFETTYSRNDPTMLKQLREAEKYRSAIEEAAQKYNLRPALIGGIGSRESHWGLALRPPGPEGTGDFHPRNGELPPDGGGWGRGLMQIDYKYHEFARTGNWKDPRENILYAAKLLDANLKFFRRKTSLTGKQLLRAAVAAYNAGPGNVLRAVNSGKDVDYYTTGRDYSRDVFNRAGFFQLHGWE
ncbi:MAG: lysozyme [Calditrichaeota bacterium]|nr:MAG: lysozyme [Calditrichota bacterium]